MGQIFGHRLFISSIQCNVHHLTMYSKSLDHCHMKPQSLLPFAWKPENPKEPTLMNWSGTHISEKLVERLSPRQWELNTLPEDTKWQLLGLNPRWVDLQTSDIHIKPLFLTPLLESITKNIKYQVWYFYISRCLQRSWVSFKEWNYVYLCT